MWRKLTTLLVGASYLFASFSSSPTYQLQNYSVGGAASNSAASPTYKLETNTGQLQSGPTSSTNHQGLSGNLQAQQAPVPPAPTLSNGGGTYYNMLGIIVNVGGNAGDATYAIAVSSNSFVTTYYVQIDGSLGATPLFQTYTQWGGATGTTIIGLANSTTYEAKVSAMQGLYTNSAYGPYASSATSSPSLTFSISPSSLSLPSLLSGSVETGGTMTASFATNANYGGSVYVSDSNAGLKSLSRIHTISSATGNLASLTHGYGMQGTGAAQTSGGPLSILSPYNGSSNNVGILSTTPSAVFTSSSAIVGGSGTAVLQAKASSTDPASSDYSDILTFIAAASF